MEFTYPHISSIRFCKGKRRGTDTVVISTVGAEEYSFQSPNADDVVQLVNEFIDGLKKKSKYLLATKAQKDSGNVRAKTNMISYFLQKMKRTFNSKRAICSF